MTEILSNCFEFTQLITRIRKLREITGGSTTCGWMADEGVFLVYTFIKWYKPELVIQTGHLWGKSALIICEALNDGFLMEGSCIEDQGQNVNKHWENFVASNIPVIHKTCEVVSVDPEPLNVPNYQIGIDYIQEFHSNFRFYKMTSNEFFDKASQLLKNNPKGKRIMGIVDGDHSWLGCLADLENLEHLGAELIFVDDTSWLPHLRRICQVFAKSKGYDFYDFRAYGGCGILIKQDNPLDHFVDDYYVGFPRIAEIAYRVAGFKFAKRIFDVMNVFKKIIRYIFMKIGLLEMIKKRD